MDTEKRFGKPFDVFYQEGVPVKEADRQNVFEALKGVHSHHCTPVRKIPEPVWQTSGAQKKLAVKNDFEVDCKEVHKPSFGVGGSKHFKRPALSLLRGHPFIRLFQIVKPGRPNRLVEPANQILWVLDVAQNVRITVTVFGCFR